jgi:hypothetical protein
MTDKTKQPRTVADELHDLETQLGISKQRVDELRRIISSRNKGHHTLGEVLMDIGKINMTDNERSVMLFEYGVSWMTTVVRNQNANRKIH